jgi:hypothetical protein
LKNYGFHRAVKIPEKILFLLIFPVVAYASVLLAASPNPYPNELNGFMFYAKYMAPLLPYISDHETVVRIMGSGEGLQLSDWRIVPLYACPDPTTTCSDPKRLASIDVSPKRRVSMLGAKFSPAFIHSYGGVSEINVTCDVYKDDFGLEYWIYSADFASGKKGDLLRIVYGPNKQIEQKTDSSQ